MFKINPYRPGAGLMPIYLAGRDDDLENIDSLFMAMTYNIPVQSVIFSGLRGVGKTVLSIAYRRKRKKKIFSASISKWRNGMTLFRRLQAVHRHFYEKSVQRKSLNI